MQSCSYTEPNLVSWSAVIAGFACAALGAINEGKEIHAHSISTGLNSIPFVCNALIEMYFGCHDFMSAELVFHIMVESDVVTWNGLIAGCMENEHYELVLDMVNELQSAGLKPDIYTTGMIIPLCSRLLSLGQGKQAHSYAIRHGFDTDVRIGATLVDVYAKCGAIRPAVISFGRILWHNLVSFNSLLSGYAMNGLQTEGLQLFQQMLEDEIIPDSITFLSVLSLCDHAGSVEDGLRYFSLMEDYAGRPTLKHYTCMVDLFSRAGKLDEAFIFVQNLPVEPDGVVWGALLSGCAVHCDVRLGETAADRLIEVEGDDAGAYVLAAKMFGGAGRLEDFARMRRNIGDMRMWKRPGWSWIEEKGRAPVFRVNDSSHVRAREIYAAVGNLNS
ncbi:putative pentatricopeptide repeat-containing protein [Platanthera guangdongensis]|uniref:Pentatricopeptide repeat-containing protein n=1 Tax=Platanthera guangdongensis TaxID=2320717 RepID=A0ABR2MYW6_9ASPA